MPEKCPECKKETLHKNGRNKGRQAWRCRNPECGYTRIDGAGIHGSKPKVKTEALTPLEKNHRSKPVTGTAKTGRYWYVISTDDTEDGFIALVRGKRREITGKNVRLLSSYPAKMQRWYWERRSEDIRSNKLKQTWENADAD